jgi:alkylhydroperoxidase family enzyme
LEEVQMRWFTRVNVILVCAGPLALAPRVADAQQKQPVPRTLPFERLTSERVKDRPCPDTSEVCRIFGQYAGMFHKTTLLPDREKELVILRTTWLNRGEFIWGRHVVIGKKKGVTDEEIARVPKGPDAPGWSESDAALLRAADELHMSRFISHNTWNTLAKKFSEPQIVEAIILVGDYTQLAMFQNTLGQQQYKGDPPIPPDDADRR